MKIEIEADHLTNGEVLTLLFPNALTSDIYADAESIFKSFNIDNNMSSTAKTSWWNAPYNREEKDSKDRCVYCKAMFDGFCAKAKRDVDWDDMFHNQPHKPEFCPGREPSDEYHD